MFVDVRCQYCDKLLCRVSRDFFGLVDIKCRHCKRSNVVSLAVILKQVGTEPAILPLPLRAPAQ